MPQVCGVNYTEAKNSFIMDTCVLLTMFVIINPNHYVYESGVTVVRSPDILGKTMRDLFIARGIAITPK